MHMSFGSPHKLPLTEVVSRRTVPAHQVRFFAGDGALALVLPVVPLAHPSILRQGTVVLLGVKLLAGFVPVGTEMTLEYGLCERSAPLGIRG